MSVASALPAPAAVSRSLAHDFRGSPGGDAMKLRRNEPCPVHRSLFCCGREQMRTPTRLQPGVRRVEDPHHPRGYRELRSPAEMRKLLNRKIVEQSRKCAICHDSWRPTWCPNATWRSRCSHRRRRRRRMGGMSWPRICSAPTKTPGGDQQWSSLQRPQNTRFEGVLACSQ